MDPIKQQIAIAEVCGWKEIGSSGVYQNVALGINGCMPGGKVHQLRVKKKLPGANSFLVPDYLTDLNAMHEAELHLKPQQLREYHRQCLNFGEYTWSTLLLSAPQKAEAFLKALNLWVD